LAAEAPKLKSPLKSRESDEREKEVGGGRVNRRYPRLKRMPQTWQERQKQLNRFNSIKKAGHGRKKKNYRQKESNLKEDGDQPSQTNAWGMN